MKSILLVMGIIYSVSLFATDSVSIIVDAFYAQSGGLTKTECDDYRPSQCEHFSCSRLGSFGCDSAYEIEQVRRSCRGIYNTRCMSYLCQKAGAFSCDSLMDLDQVTSACRGLMDEGCIRYTCDQLGPFDCDSVAELRRIADSCAGRSW